MQIDKGKRMLQTRIRTMTGLTPALKAQNHWNTYNLELLTRFFEGNTLADKYREATTTTTPNSTYQRASRGAGIMRHELTKGVEFLTSILERLDLLSDSASDGINDTQGPE